MKPRTTIALIIAVGVVIPSHAALVISKSPTNNVNCSGGVCTATALDAVLNVKELKKLLKRDNLAIASGSAAQDIEIDANFQWTKPHLLTLDAFRTITFKVPVAVEGKGSVALVTNDGGSGGDFFFVNKGKIAFWDLRSHLTINGQSYTLVNSVAMLAAAVGGNPGGKFALTRGYDASIDGPYRAFAVITPLSGRFEGLGHSIDNLTLLHTGGLSDNIGMFAGIAPFGAVRDFTLTNVQIPSDKESAWVGALAPESDGMIQGVIVRGGSISSPGCAGGLVSVNAGTIKRSAVVATAIDSSSEAGGLACANNGMIVQSGSSASVAGGLGSGVGGLLSSNGGTVSQSYSIGPVEAGSARFGYDGGSSSGGFVDYNHGSIDQSWSSSPVDGGTGAAGETHESDNYTGGFVDWNYGTITRSYTTGTVDAGDYVYMGGFVDINAQGGAISDSYTISHLVCGYCRDKGPFYGAGCPIGSDDYWDSDKALPGSRHRKPDDCAAVSSLTDAQFKSALPPGFDPAVWGQSASINNGYPYLLANPPPQ